MTTTLIIVCSRCGGLLMAKDEHKTRTCPYCGSQVDVHRAKRAGSAENSYKASELLKKLKSESGQKQP